MQVAGVENILLIPASAVLVIAIAIILIRKMGGMKRGARREETHEKEAAEFMEDEDDGPVRVQSDDVQKYKAKIDQLTTALNLEREKVKSKEEQLKEHEKSYENELLKVNALKDEVPFLRKKIGELQEAAGASKGKFDAEIEKIRAKSETALAEQKSGYEGEIKKLREKVEDTLSSSEALGEKLKEEARLERESLLKKHREELAEKDREIRSTMESAKSEKENLKKELLGERQDLIKSYEEKILDVKGKTKDTIQRLVDEKDLMVERLKDENERLEEEVDRLKERIRLLEVDRL